MAVYKVPQDVEADDKLIGPFSFRQVIYLFIVAGLGGIAYLLFGVFPLLAVLPVPPMIFLLILALPLKKDQPMETYLAAVINFYLKPSKRFWNPGQRESTIQITAPKKIEGPKIRALSEEEASHRLSFLANIIDSNGQSVKEGWTGAVQEEYVAEAAAAPDMFENYDSQVLTSRVQTNTNINHEEALAKMRAAIAEIEGTEPSIPAAGPTAPTISNSFSAPVQPQHSQTFIQNAQPTTPTLQPLQPFVTQQSAPQSQPVYQQPQIPQAPITQAQPFPTQQPTPPPQINPAQAAAMQQLSNNNSYTVETIAKEANRIQNSTNETYISLH